MDIGGYIRDQAIQIGFDVVGITTAEAISRQQVDYIRTWLAEGKAAQMEYMHRNFEKRIDPAALMEGARSVVCVGLGYRLSDEEQTACEAPRGELSGRVADFALFDDYHLFVRGLLRQLVGLIERRMGKRAWKYRICVDSVPIAERSLAQRAGLGFIGKNHMLTDRRLGSQVLLGLLITDIEMHADSADTVKCGGCDKCIRACPTGALSADGGFDSGRCISYLTIEHTGRIDSALAECLGDRLFGCDECTKACPYTEDAPARRNRDLKLRPQRRWLGLREIMAWSEDDFDKLFAGSTVERTGLEKLKRNAAVCMRNVQRDHGARNVSFRSQGTSRPS